MFGRRGTEWKVMVSCGQSRRGLAGMVLRVKSWIAEARNGRIGGAWIVQVSPVLERQGTAGKCQKQIRG